MSAGPCDCDAGDAEQQQQLITQHAEHSTMSNRPSLLIPVRGSDENVEVFIDELPEDADDILAILQAEIAPLDIWLKFAVWNNINYTNIIIFTNYIFKP